MPPPGHSTPESPTAHSLCVLLFAFIQTRLRGSKLVFRCPQGGDVDEGSNHTVGAAIAIAIGTKSRQKHALVGRTNLSFDILAVPDYGMQIFVEVGIVQPVREIPDLPAFIGCGDIKKLTDARREPFDAKSWIEKQGTDICGSNQVLEIIVGVGKRFVFRFQLGVHRLKLFRSSTETLRGKFRAPLSSSDTPRRSIAALR